VHVFLSSCRKCRDFNDHNMGNGALMQGFAIDRVFRRKSAMASVVNRCMSAWSSVLNLWIKLPNSISLPDTCPPLDLLSMDDPVELPNLAALSTVALLRVLRSSPCQDLIRDEVMLGQTIVTIKL